MRVPPSLILIGAVVVSAVVAAADPVARPSDALRVLGGILAAGVGVAGAGVVEFRRQRTTVDPRYPERATALVAAGIYRWTRNPMYLGLTSVALGAAAALGSPMALLRPCLLALYLDQLQIPAEEQALRARFGVSFEAYVGTVHRWLGRCVRRDVA